MNRALSTLRAVQWFMLASVPLYGVVGEVAGPDARGVNPAVGYVFTTLGVAIVGVIFVVRRTLVLRAADTLAAHPEDSLSLHQWQTGYFATYALCEALAIFGVTLRFLGGNLQQSLPYYIGAFALLFFFRPRAPQPADSASQA